MNYSIFRPFLWTLLTQVNIFSLFSSSFSRFTLSHFFCLFVFQFRAVCSTTLGVKPYPVVRKGEFKTNAQIDNSAAEVAKLNAVVFTTIDKLLFADKTLHFQELILAVRGEIPYDDDYLKQITGVKDVVGQVKDKAAEDKQKAEVQEKLKLLPYSAGVKSVAFVYWAHSLPL